MDGVIILNAIKSIFELNQGYNSLDVLLEKVSDRSFAQKINNEVKRRNYGVVTIMIENYLFENAHNPVAYGLMDIKQFDFDFLENHQVKSIKDFLGISTLNLNTATTLDGNQTDLFRHWDNLDRFAVLIKKELVEEIKINPSVGLNLSKEIVLAKLGYYTKFTIEKYDPSDEPEDLDPTGELRNDAIREMYDIFDDGDWGGLDGEEADLGRWNTD